MLAAAMHRTPLGCGRRVRRSGFVAFAFLIALVAGVVRLPAQSRELRTLGVSNGLAAKVVSSLVADRDGFLWVGSREGLYRYDGYQAERYLPDANDPTAISDLDIRTVYEDGNGIIWVGTNTGGLNRFDPATGGFERFRHDSADPESLSFDSVYGIVDGPAGDLWLGSQEGLNRLDRASGRFRRYFHDPQDPASLSANWTYALLVDASGSLWVGTVGGGLDRWRPETDGFARHDLAALSGGPAGVNDVFALVEDGSGVLWAGTRTGVIRIDPQQKDFRHLDLIPDADEPLVTSAFLTDENQLLLTTIAHGLLRVDTAARHPIAERMDPQAPPVPLLSVVKSGQALFVGTWGDGVLFGRDAQLDMRWLSAGPGRLNHKNVTAVRATEQSGRPWVGTFGGGPQRVDVEEGIAETWPETESALASAGVQAMDVTREHLHIGTTRRLWQLDLDGREQRYFEHRPDAVDGLGEGYVTALLSTPDELWVGVGGSGLYRLRPGDAGFTAYRHEPADPTSLSGDYITCLLHESPGWLWVGTRSNGLNHCRIADWSCRRFADLTFAPGSLGRHHVTTLFRSSRGELWIGTNSGGVYQALRNPRGGVRGFRRWDTGDGLVADSVMALAEDDDGSLWISTREGLSRLDPASGGVRTLVVETGLPSGHFNANAAASDDRHLYFGAVDGLLSIPKGQPLPMQAPAPLRITAVESPRSGRSFGPARRRSGHAIDYGDPLSIRFAVLDFAEIPHEYQYRLSPDDAWIPLGPRHEVTLHGLAPGRHRFEVRGRDVFGLWSRAAPLGLTVIPPFWMTLWFRGLVVLLTVAAALTGHRLRLRALERRNRELSRLKDERERALELAEANARELEASYEGLTRLARRLESAKEEERQHLSRELHDQLGQSLTAAKMSLQLLQQEEAGDLHDGKLSRTIGLLDDMIRQVRTISLDLRPPLLDEAGLVAALESELERLGETTGVRISTELHDHMPELSPPIETVLFRVVQEAVHNALKHAGAGHIRVRLSAAGREVRVTVEDDGRGFDPRETEQAIRRGEHLGLLGIRERLRAVGGALDIDSAPDEGTRLVARVIP